MKKMLFIVVMLFLLLAALVSLVWRETHALSIEQIELPIEGLPAEFDGFRIVHISDLHGRRFDPAGRELSAVREAAPDIIVITGDYVTNRADEIYTVLPFIEALTLVAPVYAISGNHDYWNDWLYIAGRLTETGVTVLENEHRMLKRGAAVVVLAGVGDPHTGHDDLAKALQGVEDVYGIVIMLAHAPTWFLPDYRSRRPDVAGHNLELLGQVALTLVGHTHGGQIKLPLIGAVSTASGKPFPRSHVEGLSREVNGGWLYINRGLGTVYSPFRFLTRPEITVLTLREGM